MKTFKIFCLFILSYALITGCNNVNPDAAGVRVSSNKVYIAPVAGKHIINIASMIQYAQPVKFIINENAQFGSLDCQKISSGILNYKTKVSPTKDDTFSFTVLTQDNKVLMQQSVTIISTSNQQNLPCNSISSVTDYYTNFGANKTAPMTLDVLANDWMCDSLRNNITLSLDSVLSNGKVRITSDNKIEYTLLDSQLPYDIFTYRVTSKSDSSVWSSGFCTIIFDSLRFFSIPDLYYPMDSKNQQSLKVDPLSFLNAEKATLTALSGYLPSEVTINIIGQPKFGSISLDTDNLFTYIPSDTTRRSYIEEVRYEIILPNNIRNKGTLVFLLNTTERDYPCPEPWDIVALIWDITDANHFAGIQIMQSGNASVIPVDRLTNHTCYWDYVDMNSFKIISPPKNGTATIIASADPGAVPVIKYTLNDPIAFQEDEMEFEFCNTELKTCPRAKVYFKRSK